MCCCQGHWPARRGGGRELGDQFCCFLCFVSDFISNVAEGLDSERLMSSDGYHFHSFSLCTLHIDLQAAQDTFIPEYASFE